MDYLCSCKEGAITDWSYKGNHYCHNSMKRVEVDAEGICIHCDHYAFYGQSIKGVARWHMRQL